VLTAGGLYPQGWAGDLALIGLFAVLAVATYHHGLRAPAVISLVKGVAIGGAVVAVVAVALDEFGGPGPMFAAAEARLPTPGLPGASLHLDPTLYPAFATLALGSAMALLMYPHLHTATFAAASADVVRRVTVALPAWTAVLGLFGLLGIAALAAGVLAPAGNAEAAVPLLVRSLMPAALTGAIFGAFVVGALVPAAVMSIAAATLFVRNIYVEYFHPTATPKHQTRIAKLISLTAKVGAVGFVVGLRNQDAINLQLLGGVWILQTFPAVVLGLFTRLSHSRALLAGWVTGMIVGTLLVVRQGFSAVVWIGLGDHRTPVYAAIVALAVHLAVVVAAIPLLARAGRGRLRTGSAVGPS
jgi:SSS family solute:Na+ symporter